MDPSDLSSDFIIDESGSRLLSESLIHSSGSLHTVSHGDDDLSLSELSLHDRPQPVRRRPFSLLAQPRSLTMDAGDPDNSAIAEDDEQEGLHETMRPEDAENAEKLAARTREEKLQSDLYMLKKLNSAFEVYKEALKDAKSSTERVADQFEHTNALLDKYVNILAKSEKITKLILDERWHGSSADEEQMAREIQEERERIRREEEERRLAEQRERERLEREEQERQAKLEQERLERERAEAAKSAPRGSGVRGVRGTRASMRGVTTRGTSRIGATGVPRPSSVSSGLTPPGGIASRRTTSSASVRGTTASARARPSGIARRT